MSKRFFGISGQAMYLPPFRVSLEQWCDWTDNPWPKVRKVVGSGFRVPGPHENVYTMAANAALRLILNYNINPEDIGFLALGTESSTDNAIGAVIVKGMVNEGLRSLGKPCLPRDCEVPEIKQACLAGIYSVKAAIRYLALDGEGKQAIVISSDIASYKQGSTGEQTQGAGAVAQWICENPKLLELQLHHAGTASHYRGLDFRKPVKRYLNEHYRPNEVHIHDFPVFNGKFSTNCFVDETARALESMTEKLKIPFGEYLTRARAVFAHRPYQRMPQTSVGLAYLMYLATTDSQRERFDSLALAARLEPEKIRQEVLAQQELSCFDNGDAVHLDPYPNLMQLLRVFRDTSEHRDLISEKLMLGANLVTEFGNLYTAALPAWIGAGLQDACEQDLDLAQEPILALGYGSGDAADAIPMRVVHEWKEAASKLNVKDALKGAINLSQAQYQALHAGLPTDLEYEPRQEFVIHRVGQGENPRMDDTGIDYYQFKN